MGRIPLRDERLHLVVYGLQNGTIGAVVSAPFVPNAALRPHLDGDKEPKGARSFAGRPCCQTRHVRLKLALDSVQHLLFWQKHKHIDSS